MSNRLQLHRVATARVDLYAIHYRDGSRSDLFSSPGEAAESVDAQHSAFPLPGRLTVEDDWRVRDVDGERLGVIEEVAP